MRFVSWNVNGIRAASGKGLNEFLTRFDADIVCLQETKCQKDQFTFESSRYPYQYWNYAVKKGYSGTALLSKNEPQSVIYGLPETGLEDSEGRVITAEFPDYFVVCVYTPNSQDELKRLPYRMEWDEAFRKHISNLDKIKPVLITGDMNVAHHPIDIKNPKTNEHNAGYTKEERESFSKTLSAGFTDSFRYLYPDAVAYSWWSYRFRAKERNTGWRIDYWLVSDRIRDRIKNAGIEREENASDHVPVWIDLR